MNAHRWRVVAIATMLVIAGCQREARRFAESPPSPQSAHAVPLTTLQPGGTPAEPPVASPYQRNAPAMAEGKRLWSAFNCNGCHLNGGGGIGPALMDDKWIYGAAPSQVFASIADGRPNGMPTFAGKIPDQQIWQLVGYVESLGAQTPKDASPGRNDDLSAIPPEGRLPRLVPRQTGHR